MEQKKSKKSVEIKLCGYCQQSLELPIGKKKFHAECQKIKKAKYDNQYQKKEYRKKQTKRLILKEKKTKNDKIRLLGLMKEATKELQLEVESETKVLNQDKQLTSVFKDGEKYSTIYAKHSKKREELRIRKLVHKEVTNMISHLLGVNKL